MRRLSRLAVIALISAGLAVAFMVGGASTAPGAHARREVVAGAAKQASTVLTTSLAAAGQSGTSLTVKEHTLVRDHAELTGENAQRATGSISYTVYSDAQCTKEVVSAGQFAVAHGNLHPSRGQSLPPGTHYWQASYTGDEGNSPATTTCGSEVETVETGPKSIVTAKFGCTWVTYTFNGFPAGPNTVAERVKVDNKQIYHGSFTFTGSTGSNTVTVNVPTGHHKIQADAKWHSGDFKGEQDVPGRGGITCVAPPHVFVGYADSDHYHANSHPSPWRGDPGVTFEGCGYGGVDACPTSAGTDIYDAGAIRIDAPLAGGAIVVSGASVQIGACSYSPWPGLNVTVQPGNTLILTQTGKQPRCTSSSGAEQDNFDTSETFLLSQQYQQFKKTGICTNDGYVGTITLTIDGKTTTLKDAGQVLNGGGTDADICRKANEALAWSQIQ
ncbi:MAG TPA: hypothetical protein VG010_02940 [Solirubrobacteraceae bacterium]|jgi:hypothetical protein|nr:hypothetical protein [Solirubrobacteraceae bacterium]